MRILLLFLLILPVCVFAQDTISGSVTAGGQVLSGNMNRYTFNTNTDWTGRHLKNDWDIAPSYRFTYVTGILKEQEFYSTESYFYRFTTRFKVLVFSEQEHSLLRKTAFRANLGIGLSYRFIRTKVILIEASEAILPDFYLSSTNNKFDNFAIRPSTRLKIRIEYYPLRLETINMVQPEALGWELAGHYRIIDQKSNINFRNSTTLDVAVKKGFSIGSRLDFIYQTYPHLVDSRVQPYDLNFVFYLKYQLHDIIPVHTKKSE